MKNKTFGGSLKRVTNIHRAIGTCLHALEDTPNIPSGTLDMAGSFRVKLQLRRHNHPVAAFLQGKEQIHEKMEM